MRDKTLKKPKYKIGDIVVYQDPYFDKKSNSMLHVYQSRIIEAYALLETKDFQDTLSWYYLTEQSNEDQDDNLDEEDILYKL